MSLPNSRSSLEITGSVIEPPLQRDISSKPIEPRQKRSTSINYVPIQQQFHLTKSPTMTIAKTTSKQIVAKLSITPDDTKIGKDSAKNSDEEIKRLKRKIDELESNVKTLNKTVKEKEKLNDDLKKKLDAVRQEEQSKCKQIEELRVLYENLKIENKNLSELHSEEINKLFEKNGKDNFKITSEHEKQIQKLKDEFALQTKTKDEKLEVLKKQISNAFKDNSWERQLQIDELSKELKRTQDEYDMVKNKFKAFKGKNSDTCEKCAEMAEKLNHNTKSLKDKDQIIYDLVAFADKFKNHLTTRDAEILKMATTKLLIETVNAKSINSKSNKK